MKKFFLSDTLLLLSAAGVLALLVGVGAYKESEFSDHLDAYCYFNCQPYPHTWIDNKCYCKKEFVPVEYLNK